MTVGVLVVVNAVVLQTFWRRKTAAAPAAAASRAPSVKAIARAAIPREALVPARPVVAPDPCAAQRENVAALSLDRLQADARIAKTLADVGSGGNPNPFTMTFGFTFGDL